MLSQKERYAAEPGFNHHPTFMGSKRQRRALKAPLSIVFLVFLVLVLQFFVLPGYVYEISPSEKRLSVYNLDRLDALLQKCAEQQTPLIQYPITQAESRTNSRWNPTTGQNETILLQNATLFDGEKFHAQNVDIVFNKGIIESISKAGSTVKTSRHTVIFDLNGKYVTPGLVDLHSHHLAIPWPSLRANRDENEVHMGPTTPQVRIVDSLKTYDQAIAIIASGGVTTSLVLPGSANVMGGEGILVKNIQYSGENSEPVVEDILLEHGLPKQERRRFMKIACGENPKRVYSHTRMGNAWLFRKQLERAKELIEKQDAQCLEAAVLRERGSAAAISNFIDIVGERESATDLLEYDSTIAILRGKIGVNIHCYESEDFEDMLSHSKEFGFRIQAFHHALDAWEVPEMIKASGQNITIATFAEFGLYKKEGYDSNLWAGKILADHGVPVAYKSDHVNEETNAKYLLFQAATAHSFHLSENLALQSVTSIPAKSLQVDHRIGFVRPGYDADLVVWDSHPLSLGATALQVYIDGKTTLDPKKVADTVPAVMSNDPSIPSMRKVLPEEERYDMCSAIEKRHANFTITGITKSYLKNTPMSATGNYTLVVEGGKIICFDSQSICSASAGGKFIALEDGHASPGLTAVTASLGLAEIPGPETSDGTVSQKSTKFDSPEDVAYAKYGVHLEGRAFVRARIGGVTRAVTAPLSNGFVDGVSVGISTSGKNTILDGGIFQDDVALHYSVGYISTSTESISTISLGISKIRQLVSENEGKDNIYGRVSNGTLPLVVNVENEYVILQLIKIAQDFPKLNLVLMGGSGAHLAAKELASSGVPLILTANRGGPASFERRNALPGPPLSRSPAAVLHEAGVKFGLAIDGESDSHLHNIPHEASWAGKYAGLSPTESLALVSTNIEEILRLPRNEDIVIYEGDPMNGLGATVAVVIDGKGAVSECWPEAR